MTCTFFGHRDSPESIRGAVRETITELIENKGADVFYVGNEGAFDRMVRDELKLLSEKYRGIGYFVVLSRMPKRGEDIECSILPEAVAACPSRFAVDRRNRWMIGESDYVVSYVTNKFGGAAKYTDIARRRGRVLRGDNEL